MASGRFSDVQSRPTEFLDFTSLTLDEFQQLVPPFEGGVPSPYGGMAPRWATAHRPPV